MKAREGVVAVVVVVVVMAVATRSWVRGRVGNLAARPSSRRTKSRDESSAKPNPRSRLNHPPERAPELLEAELVEAEQGEVGVHGVGVLVASRHRGGVVVHEGAHHHAQESRVSRHPVQHLPEEHGVVGVAHAPLLELGVGVRVQGHLRGLERGEEFLRLGYELRGVHRAHGALGDQGTRALGHGVRHRDRRPTRREGRPARDGARRGPEGRVRVAEGGLRVRRRRAAVGSTSRAAPRRARRGCGDPEPARNGQVTSARARPGDPARFGNRRGRIEDS